MAISSKIKALLQLSGKDNTGLASYLGISSQALSNKFYRDSFSAADLIKIADYTECPLTFLSKDGNKISFDISDIKKDS